MTLLLAAVLAVLLTLFCTSSHAFLSPIHSNIHKNHWILSESKHPLVVSAEILSSLGDESLASPARALEEAGHAWTVDWEQVTFACLDAANAFREIQNFEAIADQLQDLSEIGGCTSVGPASSVPNLLQLQREFHVLAQETGMKEYKLVSDAIAELANEYTLLAS
jgi:hypothetical protein